MQDLTTANDEIKRLQISNKKLKERKESLEDLQQSIQYCHWIIVYCIHAFRQEVAELKKWKLTAEQQEQIINSLQQAIVDKADLLEALERGVRVLLCTLRIIW